MNIVIVCEGFTQSSLLLQPWRRIYEISKRVAAQKGFSVSIISNETANSPNKEEIEGISITRIARLTLAPITNRRELKRLILKNQPDVVVWNGAPSSAIYLNRLRTLGRPIIWDIDMDLLNLRALNRISLREWFHPYHNLLLPHLLTTICPRFIVRSIANSALISKIIVPSQYIKSSLCKIGVHSNKIEVIPSTIDKTDLVKLSDAEYRKLRSTVGFGPEDFIVTYFGSPCTLRGTDIAVLSMRKVLATNKNVKLAILSRREIGKSSARDAHLETEEAYLKKLIKKLDIRRNVRIIPGLMNKVKLEKYLLMSNAIILPFKLVSSEPPLSILEAMCLGKTVITTNLGTISEIIGKDRGILIELGRSCTSELARAILFLSERPDKLNRGMKAREFTSSLPDWDDVTLKFVHVLDTILRRA